MDGEPEKKEPPIHSKPASQETKSERAPGEPDLEKSVQPQNGSLPKPKIPAPVVPLVEDRRTEYSEVNSNIRHYSSLRFAIITVFLAATGGLASVAFNFFNIKIGNPNVVGFSARVAGFLITLLFLQYEWLVGNVLAHNRRVGTRLELAMGLTQISTRSATRIAVAHWFARILYFSFLIFWAYMIWEMARPVPASCDDCV